MWSPTNGNMSPFSTTTAQISQNVQSGPQGTVETVSCITRRNYQNRSIRRVARSEPLYRRSEVRQQPYLTSSASPRYHKLAHDIIPKQELALDLQITNDDIQAATILMLFAKRHLNVYYDKACTYSTTLECVTWNEDNHRSEDYVAPPGWLQSLYRQPRLRLMRILQSLTIPPFASPRDRRRWKNELNMNLIVSCMMLRRIMPRLPIPAVLQQAMHVAEQLVQLARRKKMPHERHVTCGDCGLLPVLPVTGQCGHTRCFECIRNNATCTCGMPAPQEMHVDTCVQYLTGKLLANKQPLRTAVRASKRPPVGGRLLHNFVRTIYTRLIQENCQALARRRTVAQRLSRGLRVSLTISPDSFTAPDVPARLPMTPQARLLHACELIGRRCYLEAAAHLARATALAGGELPRRLLLQTIALMLENQSPESVAREVGGAVRQQAAAAWLAPTDLECVLCRDTLVAPVTTPCGHTYCRHCIDHSMDYRRTCPLCMRDLSHFSLSLTKKSQFVCAALESVDLLQAPPQPDPSVVPVFVCVTAFPKVPCPLLISDPRYRVFIRRILESGSRRLGMVARNEDHTDSDYGTMLEVRDCVECDDGRIILSTIGISRFKIVERVMDGCLARVETLTDKVPTDPITIKILRILGTEVVIQALVWLKNLKFNVRSKIERAFGKMPIYANEEWWKNPDGPDWLWWLVASLPLAPELKDMMISSSTLMTRLRVMSRSLQLVTSASNYEHLLRADPPE